MKTLLAAIVLATSVPAFASCEMEITTQDAYAMYINLHDEVPAAKAKRMLAKYEELKAEAVKCMDRAAAVVYTPIVHPPKVGGKMVSVQLGNSAWGKPDTKYRDGKFEVLEWNDGRQVVGKGPLIEKVTEAQ